MEVPFRLEDYQKTTDTYVVRGIYDERSKSTLNTSSKHYGSRKSSFRSTIVKLKAQEEARLAKLKIEQMILERQHFVEQLEIERKSHDLHLQIKKQLAKVEKMLNDRKERKSKSHKKSNFGKSFVAKESFVSEEPSLAVVENPSLSVVEEPSFSVFEEPSFAVVEEPSFAVVEEPSLAVVEEPSLAVVEEPSLAVEESSLAVEESSPAMEESSLVVEKSGFVKSLLVAEIKHYGTFVKRVFPTNCGIVFKLFMILILQILNKWKSVHIKFNWLPDFKFVLFDVYAAISRGFRNETVLL